MCISEVTDISPGNLDSHSRMCDSWWVITPLWLFGLLRSFLYSSSVYSCHLFLICSASVRFIQFLSFNVPICAWNVPFSCTGTFNFLEEISSLSYSIVFLSFLALTTEEGFLISPCYSDSECLHPKCILRNHKLDWSFYWVPTWVYTWSVHHTEVYNLF